MLARKMENKYPHLTLVENTNYTSEETTPDISVRKTDSIYKSNGVRKARAADPIRKPEHITAMQNYYLERNELRNYLVITLGIVFGVRGGDLMKLTVGDIFNHDGTVRSEVEIIEQKTRKFNRFPIPETCHGYLDQYLEERQNVGPVYAESPLFISSNRDEYGNERCLSTRQADRIIKAAAKACNVPGNISTHSLRKTFAYQALMLNEGDGNVDRTVQYMLNHDSMETTLRYCGITDDDAVRVRLSVSTLV